MANVQCEGDLQRKTKERYINDPETQRLPSEFCNGKAFKEVKLVNRLLKYKQSLVHVPKVKLRVLVVKYIYSNPIAKQWNRKNTHDKVV